MLELLILKGGSNPKLKDSSGEAWIQHVDVFFRWIYVIIEVKNG